MCHMVPTLNVCFYGPCPIYLCCMISIQHSCGTVPVLCNGAIQSLLYVSVWSLCCVTLPYKQTISSGCITPKVRSCAIWTPSCVTVPCCHCPM